MAIAMIFEVVFGQSNPSAHQKTHEHRPFLLATKPNLKDK